MVTDVFVTQHRHLPIKRRIGHVSEFEAADPSTAIVKLKKKAIALGANAVVALTITETLTDPYFESHRVHAHGLAVVI